MGRVNRIGSLVNKMSDTNETKTPKLSPEAQRALAEATERRTANDAQQKDKTAERGGPKGVEPTRYGDWERKGIAYDF